MSEKIKVSCKYETLSSLLISHTTQVSCFRINELRSGFLQNLLNKTIADGTGAGFH